MRRLSPEIIEFCNSKTHGIFSQVPLDTEKYTPFMKDLTRTTKILIVNEQTIDHFHVADAIAKIDFDQLLCFYNVNQNNRHHKLLLKNDNLTFDCKNKLITQPQEYFEKNEFDSGVKQLITKLKNPNAYELNFDAIVIPKNKNCCHNMHCPIYKTYCKLDEILSFFVFMGSILLFVFSLSAALDLYMQISKQK